MCPKLLEEGAISKLSTPTSFVNATRLEVKKNGIDYRHIVDLRPLNISFAIPSVKFETLSMLPYLAKPYDKSLAIDMQSGYYALGIHADY